MAARTTKIRHDENTRLKIQATQLVNRLQDHALGKVEMCFGLDAIRRRRRNVAGIRRQVALVAVREGVSDKIRVYSVWPVNNVSG